VLGGVLVLFAIVASSSSSGSDGGILGVIFGIGNLILFGIGMVIALLLSIAILIAIFLAAVAMVDSELAAQMYSDLKKNFAQSVMLLNKQCCEDNSSDIGVTQEEYDRMKQEIEQLQGEKLVLQKNIKDITEENALLKGDVANINSENQIINKRIEELSLEVETLQSSEKEILGLVDNLTKKIQAGTDQDLKNQIKMLEQPLADTQSEIESLVKRLSALESSLKPIPTSGIFTYIETKEDQSLFIQKVEEALALEMTYAQIDDHLSQNLPIELDKIIKDHPSLTKQFIRNLRKD
jgi:DNA repair exonuclease SbcCD ATPase subunit